jgi:hypothetical protein
LTARAIGADRSKGDYLRVCLVLALFCVSLVGCSRQALLQKFIPADDESFARSHVELLKQRKFDQIERDLDPSVDDVQGMNTLTEMASLFPPEAAKTSKVVDVGFAFKEGAATTFLSLEYEFPDRWLLAKIAIKKRGGKSSISSLFVTPLPDGLENTNAFTFNGKGVSQYLALLLASGVLVFSFSAFFICLKTIGLRRKWLWCLFILVGFGKVTLNWTTGEWMLYPLAVNLPCAGITAIPAYGPWVVSIFAPIGAFMFLARPVSNQGKEGTAEPVGPGV